MIWVGVGSGRGFHPLQLGERAAQEAMKRLGKKKPDLVVLFSSSRIDQKQVLQGVRGITGDAPLVGCSGAFQITGASMEEDVAVVTLVSDAFRIRTGLGQGLRKDPRKAGQEAAWHACRDLKEKGRFFLAFSDGLSGKNDHAILGMQEVLGTSFPIVGASGADNFHFERSYQYYENQVLEDAVAGSLFFGNLAFGIGSRHGWLPLGKSRRATRVVGNILEELDGKPAVSIYEDYFGAGFYHGGEPLARHSLFYPLGLSLGGEEPILRQPLWVGPEGSLICSAEIPKGVDIRLMIGTKDSLLEATRKACEAALSGLAGRTVRMVFVFASASRKKVLGRDSAGELEILHRHFGGDIPIAGCYDYGEKFPLGGEDRLGQSVFLNTSLVLLALGE